MDDAPIVQFDRIVVRFVVPSDRIHIDVKQTSAACACPECLGYRNLMLAWPLGRFVVIIARPEYPVWFEKETQRASNEGVSQGILEDLFEKHLIGPVDERNWPSFKFVAHRQRELQRCLKPVKAREP